MSEKIKKPKLTEIFAYTDTIEYGDFKVTKQPDGKWKDAKAYFNNHPITLPPSRMKILSLLVAYKGQPVSKNDCDINGSDPVNTMKVQIHHIKSTLRTEAGESAANLIRAINPAPQKKERGPWSPNTAGQYRLVLPQLT